MQTQTSSFRPEADYTENNDTSPKFTVGSGARALRLFSKFQVLLVLVLIFIGGNVKSHEAGLSVPDWPTSFGYNMFTFPYEFWVGGIWHEHVHRLVASFLGLVTVVLATVVWFKNPRLRALAIVMVVAVCVQGLLGGLTVIMQLPAWTSSAHGMMAQAFLCMSVALAFLIHHASSNSSDLNKSGSKSVPSSPTTRKAALVLLCALFIQLGFGAFVRHTEAGLAVLDFPTVAGSYIPSVSDQTLITLNTARVAESLPRVERLQVSLHLLHRYWALFVVGAVILLLMKAVRSGDKFLRGYGWGLIAMTCVQVALGISVVLTRRIILPTSLHVVLGALMIALTFLILMRARGVRAQ